jgi:hypothetical protein
VDIFDKLDSSGDGRIIGGSDWATRTHLSNDPLDPWRTITIQQTGEKFPGMQSRQPFFDETLPDWMKR